MSKNTSLMFVAVALSISYSSIANASPIPKAIKARYTKLIAIIHKNDMKAYDAFLPADYVSVDSTGKITHREEYLVGIHDLMKGATKVIFNITFKGSKTHNGIVDVAFDCTGKLTTPTGETTFHEVGTDSWKKTGKGWSEIKTVDKIFDVKSPKTATK